MAIPNHYYPSAYGIDNGSRSTDTHKDMKTITPKVRQVDVFGGYTAAAGHNVYTARSFPKKYWNNIAFVAEPTGHVLHQNILTKKGTNYNDTEGFNLMAGADEWFSPVFAEVGPDGAVWVADWYSFIIQHNPRPDGFIMGQGNAYETDLRDYTHGRIYRVQHNDAPSYSPLSLSMNNPKELVQTLKNTNMFWRNHAQRLLVERNNKDVVPDLLALVNDFSVDEIGINAPAIHALWVLHGLNAIEGNVLDALLKALKHPCHGVRKTILQLLPATSEMAHILIDNKLMEDKEPLVVLNTLLALSKMTLDEKSKSFVLNALENSKDIEDRWIPDAYACIIGKNVDLLHNIFDDQVKKASEKATEKVQEHAAHQHAGMNMSAEPKKMATSNQNKPDLIISNIKIEPANPAPRDRINVSIEVTNQGDVSVQKGVVLPLNIRFSGKGQVIDLVSQVHSEGVKPGETVTITKNTNGPWSGNISFAGEFPGDYNISVSVDKDNSIAESLENNNALTKKVSFVLAQTMPQFVLAKSVKSHASLADVTTVIAYLQKAKKLDANGFDAILKAVSEGWNYRKKVVVPKESIPFLNELLASLSGVNKDRLTRLMQAWDILKKEEMNDPNVQIVKIKSLREMMQYDLKSFTVSAGKTVEIVFENPDAMQHNLVIGKPKSLEKIGKAADKMITDPNGATNNYVPEMPEILFSTALVNPDQTVRLRFTAPLKPGDYPYICTFPGHWRLMNGVMTVK
jgi:azurin